MMKARIILLILLLPITCYSKGEGGASVLSGFNLGVGVRPRSLADAYVAVADDVLSTYWNTAGLVNLKQKELYLAYHKFLVDITHQYLCYGQRISEKSYAGISLYLIDYGKMSRVEEDPQNLLKYAGTYSAKELYVGLSYAGYIKERLSVGGKLKFMHQRIDKNKLSCVAFDIGSLYKLTDNLNLGLTIDNLGPAVGKDRLQTRYTGGIAYKYNRAPVSLLSCLSSALYSDKRNIELNIGEEISLYDCLYLRVGYKCLRYEGSNKFSVGAGLRLKFLQVDFAWLPYTNQEENLYNYSILLRF